MARLGTRGHMGDVRVRNKKTSADNHSVSANTTLDIIFFSHRLYVFKEGDGDDPIQTLHISKQSAYLFGRDKKVVDILVEHPSLSKQHCVLQYRAVNDKRDGKLRCKPYLMDLGSTNGTVLNGKKLDDARYYELREQDVIKLGESTREYVLLADKS